VALVKLQRFVEQRIAVRAGDGRRPA
jgi:hypothetical protein